MRYPHHRPTARSQVLLLSGLVILCLISVSGTIAFFELGSALESRTRGPSELRNFRLYFMVGAGFVALFWPMHLVFWRAGVRKFFHTLETLDDEVRERNARAEVFRVVEGQVELLCGPSELLFSPLTHRACVGWCVVTTRGDMPWNDDGAYGTDVSETIPFGLATENGSVRIERLERILVPRVEGLARKVGRTFEERGLIEVVKEFYHGRGGPGEAYASLRNARGDAGPITTYELIIPPQGHVKLLAGLYDGDLTRPTFVIGDTLHIEAARVFVGAPAEVSRAIREARSSALHRARVVNVLGFLVIVSALVYAYLVYYGYLD